MTMREGWAEATGAAVRAERAARQLTQEGVSDRSGIPIASYRRYDRGELAPNLEQLAAIAMALSIPLSQLVAEIVKRRDATRDDDPARVETTPIAVRRGVGERVWADEPSRPTPQPRSARG